MLPKSKRQQRLNGLTCTQEKQRAGHNSNAPWEPNPRCIQGKALRFSKKSKGGKDCYAQPDKRQNIQPRRAAFTLIRQQPLPHHQRQQAHRQRHPENRRPTKMVDQITTHRWTQRRRQHHPKAINAQRHATPAIGINTEDQYHGQRLDNPGTQPLHNTQRNELPSGASNQRQQRGHNEK